MNKIDFNAYEEIGWVLANQLVVDGKEAFMYNAQDERMELGWFSKRDGYARFLDCNPSALSDLGIKFYRKKPELELVPGAKYKTTEGIFTLYGNDGEWILGCEDGSFSRFYTSHSLRELLKTLDCRKL